jgi:hypothetical protein
MTSLYDLSVPTFQQTVAALGGCLDRAAVHFQIEAAAHHSVWGIKAVQTGVFDPPALIGAMPFSDLRSMIAQAQAALEAFTLAEIDRWAGRELDLQIGPRRLAFTAETYILSFALPNLHFHAATAYAILRTRGVPLGKRDYEGLLRTRAE